MPHFLDPGLAVRVLDSKGGKGVFAQRPFGRGDLLAVWGGVVVDTAAVAALASEQRHYAVQIEEDLYLLTPPEAISSADFINHSCRPNAGLRGPISLVALRAIQPGEEVCYDYAMTDSSPLFGFACECATPECRGHVTGEDWRRPDLRRRYRTAFSAYLQRRIAAETVEGLAMAQARRRRPGLQHSAGPSLPAGEALRSRAAQAGNGA